MDEAHNRAVYRFESSIENFATFVAGLRSYIHMAERMPSVQELQEYVNFQLEEIAYGDDLVISFIDTAHIFQYVFTRHEIDPAGLVGKSVRDLRAEKEMSKLDALLKSDEIHLYDPMNIREGWIGIPIDFRVVKNGEVIGYMAPILNLQIVLDNIYQDWEVDEFVLRFSTEEGLNFDRQAFYNNSEIFNLTEDSQFYKNFGLKSSDFQIRTIDLYGKKFDIGIADRAPAVSDNSIIFLLLGWVVSIVVFAVILVFQLARLKRLNFRLHDREQKLIEAQSISKLGYWEIDIKTGRTVVSEEFYKIFDITSKVDRNQIHESSDYFRKWIHPDDLALALRSYQDVREGGESQAIDYRIIDNNNIQKHVHSILRGECDRKNNPVKVWGTIQDITQRKRAEQQLQEQYSELEIVNAELDRFVYSVTHDLKAPLANMQGIINLTKEKDQVGLFLKYRPILESSVQKMKGFIDELIIYARNTNQEVQKDRIVIKDFLDEMMSEHQYVKAAQNIQFEVVSEGEKEFLTDQSRIRIVLNNLVSNAIKYHDNSKADQFVRVYCKIESNQAIFKVEDNGLGMNEEDARRIFDMFYRVTNKSSTVEGTGIGLHIVKEAIKKIGGTISTESKISIGTTFTITIPISQ